MGGAYGQVQEAGEDAALTAACPDQRFVPLLHIRVVENFK